MQHFICQGLKKHVRLERDIILLKATWVARIKPCVCDSAETFDKALNQSATPTNTENVSLGDISDTNLWLIYLTSASHEKMFVWFIPGLQL